MIGSISALSVWSLIIFTSVSLLSEDRGTITGAIGAYQQNSCQFGPGSASAGLSGNISYSYPMGGCSVSYSSAGGESWSYGGSGAITRGTKWGVPQCNDNDIFLLDGEELVKAAGSNPVLYHTKNKS